MTIHVGTRVATADEPTILTLEGVADNGLLAMLADGIASLASPECSLVVDIGSLTSRSHGDGHALLARLLDERCQRRVVLRSGKRRQAMGTTAPYGGNEVLTRRPRP